MTRKHKRSVFVRTTFSAVHCWPECLIAEMSFLQYPHRHLFHVELHAPVLGMDRDVEFLSLKGELDKFIASKFTDRDLGSASCELLCSVIAARFADQRVSKVVVSEDNENGATLEIEYDNE